MTSDSRCRRWRRLRQLGALCALALAAAAPAAAGPGDLRSAIADLLVVPTPTHFDTFRWQQQPKVIALYYGADWCAPCQVFVPELISVRDALKKSGADTEVVYVSLDQTETDMRRYMRKMKMPWPAIDYRRLSYLPRLKALGGEGPPNLVLIGPDGAVLANGWQNGQYVGLKPVLKSWLEATGSR